MDLIRRATRLLGWTGGAAILIAGWFGLRAAVGVAGGVLWSMANLFVMTQLVTGMTRPHRLGLWRHVGLWALKFPVLYALAGILLVSPWSSPVGFICGFSLWFVALLGSAFRPAARTT